MPGALTYGTSEMINVCCVKPLRLCKFVRQQRRVIQLALHICGFSPWLVESTDAGPSDMKGQLYNAILYKELEHPGFWYLWRSWNQSPPRIPRDDCASSQELQREHVPTFSPSFLHIHVSRSHFPCQGECSKSGLILDEGKADCCMMGAG